MPSIDIDINVVGDASETLSDISYRSRRLAEEFRRASDSIVARTRELSNSSQQQFRALSGSLSRVRQRLEDESSFVRASERRVVDARLNDLGRLFTAEQRLHIQRIANSRALQLRELERARVTGKVFSDGLREAPRRQGGLSLQPRSRSREIDPGVIASAQRDIRRGLRDFLSGIPPIGNVRVGEPIVLERTGVVRVGEPEPVPESIVLEPSVTVVTQVSEPEPSRTTPIETPREVSRVSDVTRALREDVGVELSRAREFLTDVVADAQAGNQEIQRSLKVFSLGPRVFPPYPDRSRLRDDIDVRVLHAAQRDIRQTLEDFVSRVFHGITPVSRTPVRLGDLDARDVPLTRPRRRPSRGGGFRRFVNDLTGVRFERAPRESDYPPTPEVNPYERPRTTTPVEEPSETPRTTAPPRERAGVGGLRESVEVELARARRLLSGVQFAGEGAETEAGIRYSLGRELEASNRLRDVLIRREREREAARDEEKRNESLLQERIAGIREEYRQKNYKAEQDAQRRIARLQSARVREEEREQKRLARAYEETVRQYAESEEHVYGLFEAHERQRNALETANRGIALSFEGLGSSVRNFGSNVRGAFDSMIFRAESFGRSLQEQVTAVEVSRSVANTSGFRRGLVRDPRVNEDLRRTYGNLISVRRLQSAVSGIGQTRPGVNQTESPLSTALDESLPSEEDIRRYEERRRQIRGFVTDTGSEAYRRFGSDFLLNAVGIGGRRERVFRDRLEDVKERFNEISRLNEQFSRYRRRIERNYAAGQGSSADLTERLAHAWNTLRQRNLERRFERQSERQLRDFLAHLVTDIGRMVYEHFQGIVAERLTDFISDQLQRFTRTVSNDAAFSFLRRLGGGNAGVSQGFTDVASTAQRAQQFSGVAQNAIQYAGPIGPTASGVPLGTSGVGTAVGTAATAGVTLASIAVAVNGLIDPVKDLFSSFGFHNVANDQYAFEQAVRAGRQLTIAGQTPSQFGEQSARDLVDNITAGISSGASQAIGSGQNIVVELHLNDKVLQEVDVRNEKLRRQGRIR